VLSHKVGNCLRQKVRDWPVEVNGKKLEVPDHRLVGIDAPEKSKKKRGTGQPFSQRTTKYLAGLVLNRSVEVKEYGVDRYGRILGIIVLEGKDINLEMLKMGFAEVYRGKHVKGFDTAPYIAAQEEAMERQRGMWIQGMEYVSPRDWRRGRALCRKRQNQSKGAAPIL